MVYLLAEPQIKQIIFEPLRNSFDLRIDTTAGETAQTIERGAFLTAVKPRSSAFAREALCPAATKYGSVHPGGFGSCGNEVATFEGIGGT